MIKEDLPLASHPDYPLLRHRTKEEEEEWEDHLLLESDRKWGMANLSPLGLPVVEDKPRCYPQGEGMGHWYPQGEGMVH